MSKLWFVSLGSLGLALSVCDGRASAQDTVVFYVSPTGSDNNDGRSPDHAFATPERAEAGIVKTGPGTVYLMNGVYKRTSPLFITAGAQSQKWITYQNAVADFDGGGHVPDAIRIQADNVTFDGLLIRNFTNNGIIVSNGRNATITRNTIQNISSTKWSQAGILVIGKSSSANVEFNKISNTGYAGIEFFAPVGGDISGSMISRNVVSDTCKTKEDCGAIYINGRSETSDGSVISGNNINNYGKVSKSYGIYLDDFASRMKVSNNFISGSGSNPIMIHGGQGNIITSNEITVTPGQQALYYAAAVGPRMSDMSGNRFIQNVIRGACGNSHLVIMGAPGKVAPDTAGNHFTDSD